MDVDPSDPRIREAPVGRKNAACRAGERIDLGRQTFFNNIIIILQILRCRMLEYRSCAAVHGGAKQAKQLTPLIKVEYNDL